MIPGSLLASMVFPVPGGPTISRPCLPVALITITRLAISWSATSAKSTISPEASGCTDCNTFRASSRLIGLLLPRRSLSEDRPQEGRFSPAMQESSAEQGRSPSSRAKSAYAIEPRTGRTVPSNASSPNNNAPSRRSIGTWPVAHRIAAAIGRSKAVPLFFISAGARFTVTWSLGVSNPHEAIAHLIRDLASRTAPSGIPTIVSPGMPPDRLISTETGRASMPRRLAVLTVTLSMVSTIRPMRMQRQGGEVERFSRQ